LKVYQRLGGSRDDNIDSVDHGRCGRIVAALVEWRKCRVMLHTDLELRV
jgi:hypothetical protein